MGRKRTHIKFLESSANKIKRKEKYNKRGGVASVLSYLLITRINMKLEQIKKNLLVEKIGNESKRAIWKNKKQKEKKETRVKGRTAKKPQHNENARKKVTSNDRRKTVKLADKFVPFRFEKQHTRTHTNKLKLRRVDDSSNFHSEM